MILVQAVMAFDSMMVYNQEKRRIGRHSAECTKTAQYRDSETIR